MLISCFQCRQQLDVPEDSAGKRVRCPHCEYVIVVPAPHRPLESAPEEAPAPMMALPSLELDGDAPKPIVTKVSPQPLPPVPMPTPIPEVKPKPKPKSEPEIDEMPPIDRRARRRVPMTPLASRFPWGKVLGLGAVVFVIVIGVIAGIVSSQANRRRHAPGKMAFNPPVNPAPIQPMPPMQPQFPGQFMPNINIPPQMNLAWQDFQDRNRRFKAQFPGIPVQREQQINFAPMTVYETPQQFEWSFSVAHRALPDKEFQAVAEVQRFDLLRDNLANANAANLQNESRIRFMGDHPGREWEFLSPNNNWRLFVQTFFVPEGNVHHHYILTVRAPRNVGRQHQDITHFFNSFQVLIGLDGAEGQHIYEQIDDLQKGGRRDDEFTALALHPTQPIAVLGSASGQVAIVEPKRQIAFALNDGKPIRHAAISPDGVWLALAVDKEISLCRNWQNIPAAAFEFSVKGDACVFTKDRRLLVALKNEVAVYECGQDAVKPVDRLPMDDLVVRGLALAPDERTLAVFGDRQIELWQWPEKKKLGRIDAHDERITAVAFSPDGKTLASASADRSIKLWDVKTRKEHAVLKQHAWTVASLAFTPDGKYLASGGLDGMLLLWDLQPQQPRLAWAQAHQFPVRAVAFDKNGQHCFLTCKHPNTHPQFAGKQWTRQLRKIAWKDIKLDPQAGQRAERLVAQRAGLHLPTMGGAAHLSPDGRFIVTTTSDKLINLFEQGTLRVWDAASATVLHAQPARDGGGFSPDGKWFVFAKPGQRVDLHVLEVETGRVQPGVARLNAISVPPIVFTPDSKSLWALSKHELIRCDLPTLAQKGRLQVKAPNDPRLVTIHVAADHQTFLVERRLFDGGVRQRTLHASADGKVLPIPKVAPGGWSSYTRLATNPGGHVELEDFLLGFSQVIGQQRTRGAAACLQQTRKYGATNETGVNNRPLKIHIWDIEARRPVLTLHESEANNSAWMRFSPAGDVLAVATTTGWTRIMPTEWLIERKDRLTIDQNDVAAP